MLVSGKRDLVRAEISGLKAKFGAVAANWVAGKNNVRRLTLHGVTDLVDQSSGEANAGKLHLFVEGTETVFTSLLRSLSAWLAKAI